MKLLSNNAEYDFQSLMRKNCIFFILMLIDFIVSFFLVDMSNKEDMYSTVKI